MAFAFKSTEAVEEGIRRMARECADHALDQLKAGRKPEAIHRARKEIKRLRALLTLVRDGLGSKRFRRHQRRLRAAARSCAAARDAQVRAEALQQLLRRNSRGASRRAFRALAATQTLLNRRSREATRQFRTSGGRKEARRLLRKERRQLRKLRLRQTGWELIGPALERAYAAGRNGRDLARAEPSAKHFHAWRKRVKELWYYLQLLAPARPKLIRATTEPLETLGEVLGQDHDLHLLRRQIRPGPGRREADAQTAQLDRLITRRQSALRAAALRLGDHLYRDEPAAFARRFRRSWKLWRAGRGFDAAQGPPGRRATSVHRSPGLK